MKKLDFAEVRKLMNALTGMDDTLTDMISARQRQEERIRKTCSLILINDAEEALKDVSVDELKKSRAGIRVQVLKDSGYTDMLKLSCATDSDLADIQGIGDKQIEAVRNITAEFINKLSSCGVIRLSLNEDIDSLHRELMSAVYEYRKCEAIRRETEGIYPGFHEYVQTVQNERIISNSVRWVFSGRELKEHTASVIAEMASFCNTGDFEMAMRYIRMYREALVYDEASVLKDYESNSADYYAVIENLGGGRADRELIYSSVPAQLADEIDASMLNTEGFHGTLRSYQVFGVKYILHQEMVLLGDEMGLGKTIQAIAAMAHIASSVQIPRFLIVCPASVLVNWCREIRKFCDIPAYLVHGAAAGNELEKWCETGGAAVANYEMMGRIIDRIDEKMKLDMLIVDEAHYIKNPDAKRTGYIRRLDNESERILMMTGTPLENHVDEMCSLIDFIRPDMSDEIRRLARVSSVPQFREVLAPFYLRRTREQVLNELPGIEEKNEWCMMTEDDIMLYSADVAERDFAGMRRVAFRQQDPSLSSKGRRLMELCDQAADDNRKTVVYSYFRETTEKVSTMLGRRCAGVIGGDTKAEERQAIIDRFAVSADEDVLVCQIQAGGTGLNIQAASIVIICEPQIKPSLTAQAVSRVYRMGQVRNVLVFHLLCENTVDEAMLIRLEEKQAEFDTYAGRSSMGEALDNLLDREWIQQCIDSERKKYLPMMV